MNQSAPKYKKKFEFQHRTGLSPSKNQNNYGLPSTKKKRGKQKSIEDEYKETRRAQFRCTIDRRVQQKLEEDEYQLEKEKRAHQDEEKMSAGVLLF